MIDLFHAAVLDAPDERVEGAHARDRALQAHQAARSALIDQCREAMIGLYVARLRGDLAAYVTGDDASLWLDAQGYTGERRVIGAVFRPRSGWRTCGSVMSRLKRRHGRRVTCWQWVGLGPD